MENNFIKLTELTSGVSDAYRVYDADGVARTIKAEAGGLGAKTGLYKLGDETNTSCMPLVLGGVSDKKFGTQFRQGDRVYSTDTVSPALAAQVGNAGRGTYIVKAKSNIRRLTPKECFRLMGFEDKDFEVCKANGISDTQLYKMAGNSIVVDVLYYIFKNLFKE